MGKAVHHVHRFAAFLQTIENADEICSVYLERFKCFPLERSTANPLFFENVTEIFGELFTQNTGGADSCATFSISIEVVDRAIDLTSGLVQQLNIFMDDSNVPANIVHVTANLPASSSGVGPRAGGGEGTKREGETRNSKSQRFQTYRKIAASS